MRSRRPRDHSAFSSIASGGGGGSSSGGSGAGKAAELDLSAIYDSDNEEEGLPAPPPRRKRKALSQEEIKARADAKVDALLESDGGGSAPRNANKKDREYSRRVQCSARAARRGGTTLQYVARVCLVSSGGWWLVGWRGTLCFVA